MIDRLTQLYESASMRDVVEIAILAVAIFVVLRLLGKTRGAGIVRGLGLMVVGLFLVAQVVIASFDLTVLGRVLDQLLTIMVWAAGDLPTGVAARPDGPRPLSHPALLRARRAVSGRRQAGRRRRGDVARMRGRVDRDRAGDGVGAVHRDGRSARRGGVGQSAAVDLLQAQPPARRRRHPQRGTHRGGRLPVAAGPTARRGERSHGHAAPLGSCA